MGRLEAEEYREYERMGNSYLKPDYNQKSDYNLAFLCYENAAFLCENQEYRNQLIKKMQDIEASGKTTVKPVSIVIVSYNGQYLMERCVESIRENCAPGAYEIVVVDNASTDGVQEWLSQQTDIKLICNHQNLGFPAGCNVGIACAGEENDILLLNNDTRMTRNALFWLRMCLYGQENAGAAGCTGNYCGNEQQVDVEFLLPGEYLNYAARVNVPMENPYEERNRLSGFAMLINRRALNQAGMLDENLSPGYLEDDDLSLRINQTGYRLYVCHNSFIYHAGSQSFCFRQDLDDILIRNYEYFLNKWNYDIWAYSFADMEAISQIDRGQQEHFSVLQLGAGSGITLSRIKHFFPHAECVGMEQNEAAVRYGVKGIPIHAGDWMQREMPILERFDYIILPSMQEGETEQIKQRFGGCLKERGKWIEKS